MTSDLSDRLRKVGHALTHEAAVALDTKDALLAEAERALEPFAGMIDHYERHHSELDHSTLLQATLGAYLSARTTLAKLKARKGQHG